MSRLSHKTILCVYLGLFAVLGVLSVMTSIGSTMPPPGTPEAEEWERVLTDEASAATFIEEVDAMRNRQERLADISIGGFATVLGAIIGFLSASWAGRSNSAESDQRSTQSSG